MSNSLSALKRKLERWELEHLRTHAAELDERLRHAEADRDYYRELADSWHDTAGRMIIDLQDDGAAIGINTDGQFIRREVTLVLLTPGQSAELRPLIDEQKTRGGSVIAQVWPDGMRAIRITDEEHDQIHKILRSRSTQEKFKSAAASHAAATLE